MSWPYFISTRGISVGANESKNSLPLPSARFPVLIQEIGAEAAPTGRHTFNLESERRREYLFSTEIRDDLILPASGRRPFRLFGAGFLLEAEDTLVVWQSDLSTNANTTRQFIKGIMLDLDVNGKPIGPDGVDLRRQHDSYWSGSMSVSASAAEEAFAEVSDRDFIARSVTLIATGDLDLQIRSRKRNEFLWATGLRLRSIAPANTSQRNYMINPGFLFPSNDTMEFFVIDRTGSTNTVLVAVHGELQLETI